jgi:hypothetical protein
LDLKLVRISYSIHLLDYAVLDVDVGHERLVVVDHAATFDEQAILSSLWTKIKQLKMVICFLAKFQVAFIYIL